MKNNDLTLNILNSLKDKCLCLTDICIRLHMEKIEFESKMLYMSLSKLQMGNYLLTNLIHDENGALLKYYYLTRDGLKFIQQYN